MRGLLLERGNRCNVGIDCDFGQTVHGLYRYRPVWQAMQPAQPFSDLTPCELGGEVYAQSGYEPLSAITNFHVANANCNLHMSGHLQYKVPI